MSTEQIDRFARESLHYFRRNYEGVNLREIPLPPDMERILAAHPLDIQGGSVLDIGCGPANVLAHLCSRLDAEHGAGTEPSPEVADILRRTWPEFEFHVSDSRRLPLASESFDLVLLRGVLLWVDRNHVLQTLGEALRVCRRHLVISDFCPREPYSVVYRHDPRLRSYKMDYRPLLEATGLLHTCVSFTDRTDSEWNAIRTTLFERLDPKAAFPLKTREDFP